MPQPVDDRVVVVLPTYNREDVLPRAIDSVLRQTYQNWELAIVDDGSTDGTEELVRSIEDKRITYFKQENAGVAAARNRGMALSDAPLIAFLDSDDVWLPHYLELTTKYRAATDAAIVMTEFITDEGDGTETLNDFDLIANRWPKMAKRVGSQHLQLPDGVDDDYLRVYEQRSRLGDTVELDGDLQRFANAYVYTGKIFEYYRWGYIGWLPTTLLTRAAQHSVGGFIETYRTAEDYLFLSALARKFTMHMIAVPSAIKHERGLQGAELAESHLATGQHQYLFATKRIESFNAVFGDRDEEELHRIVALHELFAARAALGLGRRKEALAHLARATANGHSSIKARTIGTVASVAPTDSSAIFLTRVIRKLSSLMPGVEEF